MDKNEDTMNFIDVVVSMSILFILVIISVVSFILSYIILSLFMITVLLIWAPFAYAVIRSSISSNINIKDRMLEYSFQKLKNKKY